MIKYGAVTELRVGILPTSYLKRKMDSEAETEANSSKIDNFKLKVCANTVSEMYLMKP